ncbi:MAG TPA: polyketide cyclase / dehydrase and lipid transport [Frankiaceae bacterium]|nr:polyketide cyclase / dehydrase and lipid transport [Frankiaceae bacterium]
MPTVDLMDETFVVASPQDVAAALHEPALWSSWWPDLDLVVEKDRGVAGLQFSISGALVGSGELWLEEFGDGVVVHVFLRADPTRDGSATEATTLPIRAVWREARKRAWQTKRGMGLLKDRLEKQRPAGEPRSDLARPIPTIS